MLRKMFACVWGGIACARVRAHVCVRADLLNPPPPPSICHLKHPPPLPPTKHPKSLFYLLHLLRVTRTSSSLFRSLRVCRILKRCERDTTKVKKIKCKIVISFVSLLIGISPFCWRNRNHCYHHSPACKSLCRR